MQSASREWTHESGGFLKMASLQVPTERQVPKRSVPMSPSGTIAGRDNPGWVIPRVVFPL